MPSFDTILDLARGIRQRFRLLRAMPANTAKTAECVAQLLVQVENLRAQQRAVAELTGAMTRFESLIGAALSEVSEVKIDLRRELSAQLSFTVYDFDQRLAALQSRMESFATAGAPAILPTSQPDAVLDTRPDKV
jgi:hypothetical protein